MIKFRVRGLEEFKDYISSLERGLRGHATKWIAEWLVGDASRGLRHYVPYKYVTRKSAYGKTFQSEAQRRYVMAKIAEGSIDPGTPHRTGNLQRGWGIEGEGTKVKITNTEDYAVYVMGNKGQSRHEARVGWRKVAAVLSTNIKGAIRHAESLIKTLR